MGTLPLGPALDYSDGWELFINTVTTVITFLMVFLIQNAESRATHAPCSSSSTSCYAPSAAHAREMVRLEELTDEQIAQLREEFHRLQDREPALQPVEPGSQPAGDS